MLLQQLKSGFKKVTNWNKYQSKATMKASNQHLKVLENNFFELKNSCTCPKTVFANNVISDVFDMDFEYTHYSFMC